MTDVAFYTAPSHHELVYVGTAGTVTECFGYQPSTEDIAERRGMGKHSFCVQLVGDLYEVYDLSTLRREKNLGTWTIGIPKFVSVDPDAAIMWALMNL